MPSPNLNFWAWLSFFIVTTIASPLITRIQRSQHPVPRDIWQFPNGTFVENIAVRSNGQLLVTLLSTPDLYQVDPVGGVEPQLIHRFPNVSGLTGITEVEKDVFAVVAGNFSLKTFTSTPGSYSVWKVDMRPFKLCHHSSCSPATVTKITDVSPASFLNGMTTLDKNGNVLIADSDKGIVWRLDTRTGGFQIVIDDPLLKPPPIPVAIGINGIHIHNNAAYFTNSFRLTFNRIPIHPNGTPSGAAEVIAQCDDVCDDFTFDEAGNAFVDLNPGNMLERITPKGDTKVVVGNLNSTELVGPTAAQFGRTRGDKGTLYVTTNGGLARPVNGTYIEGGKVVGIRLS